MPRKILIRHSAPLPEWVAAEEQAFIAANAHKMPDAPKRVRKGVFKSSEHEEQSALMQWAGMSLGRLPELDMLFAIPNGGYRSPRAAIKLKSVGVKRGIPDLCLPVPRGGYHSLWIELKIKGNYPSKEQKAKIADLAQYGHKAVVCYGADEAIKEIESYLSLKDQK